MKKTIFKILSILLIIFSVLSIASCTKNDVDENNSEPPTLSAEDMEKVKSTEVRAVWVSFSEVNDLIKNNNSSEAFTLAADEMFSKIKEFGFNTVMFHVRAYSDAYYNSSVFASAAVFTGKQGGKANFDPLAIAVKTAHDKGLKIEAWINPYRISTNQNLDALADNNIARQWLTDDTPDNDSWIIKINDGGLYFNPAVEQCMELIDSGVKEIVDNYDVDGIHFDDYFYPSTEAYIDEAQFNAYTSGGGTLSLVDWRCDNVNRLVKKIYSTVKAKNENLVFGISPSGSISDNKSTHFADVATWAKESGYIDYICPQIYFGFDNQIQPFVSTAKKWQSLFRKSNVKLYFGLGLYKAGKEDTYADTTDGTVPTSPRFEFVNNKNVVSRQINYIRQIKPYSGFFVFSYDYFFNSTDEAVKEEVANIKNVI